MSTNTVHLDGGLRIAWSPVNQAWFVMWGDATVLRVVTTRDEALDYARELLEEIYTDA